MAQKRTMKGNKMKNRILTLTTCMVMMFFIACNLKFCANETPASGEIKQAQNETSDSEEIKQAQPNSFAWADGLCEYEGFFDLTKTTKQQIQNAYYLIANIDFIFSSEIDPPINEWKDIKRLNSSALKNAYLRENERLSKMELPENKIWETLRQEKLRVIEQWYKLYKIKCEAFLTDNMETLREFDKNDECLDFYATALIDGGDNLLSTWEHLTKLQASRNAYPDRIWAIYHEQSSSKNKFQYGKIQLFNYGWWNCAVKHIDKFDESKGWKEFEKLFISIKENCY